VIKRGELWVCCAKLEGLLDDEGVWQRLICTGDVRAWRLDELMWADVATYERTTNLLTLTGRPLLQRGRSVLAGERIVVDTKVERAQVEKPRGRLEQVKATPPAGTAAPAAPAAPAPASPLAALPAPVVLPPSGELPRQCPVPAAPAGSR